MGAAHQFDVRLATAAFHRVNSSSLTQRAHVSPCLHHTITAALRASATFFFRYRTHSTFFSNAAYRYHRPRGAHSSGLVTFEGGTMMSHVSTSRGGSRLLRMTHVGARSDTRVYRDRCRRASGSVLRRKCHPTCCHRPSVRTRCVHFRTTRAASAAVMARG